MKKITYWLSILIFSVFAILASSCEIHPSKATDRIYNQDSEEFKYKVIVLDSCEYIMYRTANGYLEITHKGNCKFCIERNKK